MPDLPENLPLDYAHTCMNHFAVLDLRGTGPVPQAALSRLATDLCSSPFADDMLVLETTTAADVRLRIIGGDGREADFCANGLIYTASKLGTELGRDAVTVETPAGIRGVRRRGAEWDAELGEVQRLDAELPAAVTEALAGLPVLALLRAGEPHLVLETPAELSGFNIERTEFENYCRSLRDITDIPGGVNVTMVFQHTDDSVLIRTYERGVSRHTFSCGTGAIAAVAAVFGIPGADRNFHVCSPGGMHTITFAGGRWHVAARSRRIGSGYLRDRVIHLPVAGLNHYSAQ